MATHIYSMLHWLHLVQTHWFLIGHSDDIHIFLSEMVSLLS